MEGRQAWLQIWKLILQTREYIYADNTIKNGKKRRKKIEKTRELDGARYSTKTVQQHNKKYELTSKSIICICLNILSRNYS